MLFSLVAVGDRVCGFCGVGVCVHMWMGGRERIGVGGCLIWRIGYEDGVAESESWGLGLRKSSSRRGVAWLRRVFPGRWCYLGASDGSDRP